MATQTNPILEQALAYAQNGWRLHPLIPGQKRPILSEWQKVATTAEDRIGTWFTGGPKGQAGIGIATGVASNLVVIDIDPQNKGNQSLLEMIKRFGDLPDTLTAKTPSGGQHLYFNYPTNRIIRNRAKLAGFNGVDVRAEGGYVVAPPTITTQGQYLWDSMVIEAANLPENWLKAMEGRELPPPAPRPKTKQQLRQTTCSFLQQGAGEGERIDRLRNAAIDLYVCGYPLEEAEKLLRQGAAKCKPPIEERETDYQIKHLLSKDWRPHPTEDEDDFTWDSPFDQKKATESRRRQDEHRDNVVISNIATGIGPDGAEERFAKKIDHVREAIQEATGKWPRRIQNSLFVLGRYDQTKVPGQQAIRFLANCDALFAWIKEKAEVYWETKPKKNFKTRQNVNLVGKKELFEHMIAVTEPTYDGIETLPHEPAVKDLFYIPTKLPEPTGEHLAELAQRLNPETEEDRCLILASMLTPCWGGPCGTRPAFVFTSEHGRGVGKTSTVERICEIFGGRVSLSPDNQDMKNMQQRLLSDEGLATRCVIMDNIRNQLKGQQIESLITTPTIDGHRLYHGQFKRPNRLTYYITSNVPQMSQDLAARSVIIRIGPPKFASDWETWIHPFLRDYREHLLADLYAVLKGPDQCRIEKNNLDRWAHWQKAILQKFPNGNDLAELIISRRPEYDTDKDDAEEIAEVIEETLTELGHDTDHATIIIPSKRLLQMLIDSGTLKKDFSMKGMATRIKNLGGDHSPLARLVKSSNHGEKRAWRYLAGKTEHRKEEMRRPIL